MEETNQPEITFDQLPQELIRSPYRYIREYYEKIYPFMGSKVFSVLSLVPVSLILPKISRNKTKFRSRIHFLLLSGLGSGKSSIAREFEKITFEPMHFEYITDARLYYELSQKDRVSLIVSDVARIFADPLLTKQMENILEEGIISRNTMRNKKEGETKKDIEAVAYLSGTPENINNRVIRDGMLSRVSPLISFHSQSEHEYILDYVNKEVGTNGTETFNYIPYYYKELLKIQNGEHSIYSPITGYIIPDSIKDQMLPFIKPLVNPSFQKFGVQAIRELEEAYRFMIAHAFLNVFNRRVEGGNIVVTEEDFRVAKFLIKREISTKHKIISCINAIDAFNLRTVYDLRDWVNRQKSMEKKEIGKEATILLTGMLKKN